MTDTLRHYQLEAVAQMQQAPGGFILGDACGLGKSATTINYTRTLPTNQPRFLLVVPKTLREQWQDEIHKWEPDIPVHQVMMDMDVSRMEGWFVMHYEQLIGRSAFQAMHKPIWDVIIADEAHRIKNPKAQRTIALKHFEGAMKIALTGTPMEHSPADLWAALNWHDRYTFSSYGAFFSRYVKIKPNYLGYPMIVGAKHLDELSIKLAGRYLARTKADVAPEMPPLTITPVLCKATKEQAWMYKAIREADDVIVNLKDKELIITNVLTELVRCQQLSSHPSLLGIRDQEGGKFEWLRDWLEDNPHVKAVIFVKFREVAVYLQNMFGGAICIGGKSTIKSFTDGRERIIIATIAEGGEGLDLPQAEVAIFYDQDWSSIKMTQALNRIHRIGPMQHIPKQAYMLHTFPTDRLVQRAYTDKWTIANLVSKYISGGY